MKKPDRINPAHHANETSFRLTPIASSRYRAKNRRKGPNEIDLFLATNGYPATHTDDADAHYITFDRTDHAAMFRLAFAPLIDKGKATPPPVFKVRLRPMQPGDQAGVNQAVLDLNASLMMSINSDGSRTIACHTIVNLLDFSTALENQLA